MAAGPVRELFGRSGLVKTEDDYAAELGDVVTGNSATTTEDITLVHPIQGNRVNAKLQSSLSPYPDFRSLDYRVGQQSVPWVA